MPAYSRLTLSLAQSLLASGQISKLDLALYCHGLAVGGENKWGLNAFLHLYPKEKVMEQASEANSGPLSGIPISVKANFAVKESPLTASSKTLKSKDPCGYDATVVRKLKDAGAVIIGITQMDEFGMGSLGSNLGVGENAFTKNPLPLLELRPRTVDEWVREIKKPYDSIVETHTKSSTNEAEVWSAGGSSCGSAASVSHGSSLLSVASDTGGSIRLPAAWCNVTGFKPSYGYLSRKGLVSYASSLDTVGLIAPSPGCISYVLPFLRSSQLEAVTDSTAIMHHSECRNEKPVDLSQLTVGIPSAFSVHECPASIAEIWAETASFLQEKGAKIVDIPPDSLSPGNIRTSLAAYYILASAEASSNLSRYDGLRYGVSAARIDSTAEYTTQLEHQYAATRSLGFGPEVVRRILAGTFVLSSDRFHTHYEAAAKLRAIVTNQLRKALQSVDVMIIPTSLTLPHEKSFDPTLMFANDVLTVPISLACCPAISIPWRERSPIGIQVVGSDNVTVLEVAGALSLGGRSSPNHQAVGRITTSVAVSGQPMPLVPIGLLPSYLADAFGDLFEEDGLLVLGKGLGMLSLLASFVRYYGDSEEGYATDHSAGKRPLIFVLGLKESEHSSLVSILETWGTPPDLLPTMITNESGQGKDRAVLYKSGGVFCVTSRILIVDLLTSVAVAKDIDGVLVGHAEQVTEQSTEAFILRIFKTQKQMGTENTANGMNSRGFIKAFSEDPDALLSGFAKVDKIMKALFVQKLYLYPRFHSTVADELERRPPHVDELHQHLSPTMKEIQNAIAAAVQTCIRELKASTKLLEWTDKELSVENCVTQNFDLAISRQLEHDWHRLKPQVKQLVQDLRTLRTLFQYLIHYDCVAFWKLINSIKTISAASRHPSLWLLTPAADMLFRKAKERLYIISKSQPTEQIPNPVAKLEPVLEENPKWRLLKHVVKEIHEEYARQAKSQGPVNVLIMAKDERTVESLRSYLVEGKQRTMTLRWFRYLEGHNDRSRSVTRNAGGATAISEESRLLLEEESRVRQLLFGRKGRDTAAASHPHRTLNKVPGYMRKYRRVAVEMGRGTEACEAEDLERRAVLDEALEEMEHDMAEVLPLDDGTTLDRIPENNESHWFDVHEHSELRLVIKSLSSTDGNHAGILLQDLDPKYIVFYDPDISFVRAVEIYSSMQPETEERLKVYFMLFEASAEEKTFRKALEREQNAFERLIHHKKIMATPVNTLTVTQEMQQAMAAGNGSVGSYADGSLPLAFDTRTGRGKAKPQPEKRDIAVDVREFRSALPSILHQGGMRLAPVTLTVGDFVLSNVHCVERKSISDLFGSFASGRLYTQAESMTKFYQCPCLLIEFDPSKSFCLQSSNELGIEIRTDSVCSKMVLLASHFPKLRLLWSRSPHETLRIFKTLKQSHEEVDVEKAVEIGRSESVEAFLEEGVQNEDNDEINEAARDMLLRLPGVNVHSARRIMQECDSIAELSEMSREDLKRIAGPITGQKLFTFFRQKLGAI